MAKTFLILVILILFNGHLESAEQNNSFINPSETHNYHGHQHAPSSGESTSTTQQIVRNSSCNINVYLAGDIRQQQQRQHAPALNEQNNSNWSTIVTTRDHDDDRTAENGDALHNHTKTIISENYHFQNEINTNLRYEIESYLKKYSFLYGLTAMAGDNYLHMVNALNVTAKCLADMKIIKNGIDNKEIWAIKLLDSSDTFRSGFVLGNNYWLGSKKGCDSINKKLTLTLSKRFDRFMIDNLMNELSPIEVNFRMVHAKHNSPWQLEMKFLGEGVLHLGLCVPQSCSNNEIKNLTQHIFDKKLMQLQNIYELKPDVLTVRDLEIDAGFFNKTTVKLFVVLLVTTAILSICAGYVSTDETSGEPSRFERIVKCFSLKENFESITKMEITPSSIPVINGLRSISCFWILSFHVNWFMHYTVDNEAVLFDYAEKLLFQGLANAPILVDLFFTISGFLVAVNFLKNKHQMNEIRTNGLFKNIKLFGRIMLQRYVRLTPLYIITILVTEIGTAYLVDVSHFYVHERNDVLFEKYWWRNLLYIQNFFHANDLCANWTWSLACEMQYFFVFTIILFIYAKNPEQGKKIFFSFWFIVFITTFGIALYKNFNAAFDVLYETGTMLYIGPWARIHPYFIGILSAFYLKRNDSKLYINKKYLSIIWIGAASIALFCLHATTIRDMHFVLGSLALMSQRLAFGIVVAWVIIASLTGNGNWFTNSLEHRWFVHINKISYAVYLLNPITVTMIYGLRDSPAHTDIMTTTVMTTAIMAIVYLLSVAFSLLFEVPYNRLSDEFIRVNRKKLSPKES